MDLDNQAVRAGSHGRARHRRDHVTTPGAMAGVRNDRQVAQLLHDGNG